MLEKLTLIEFLLRVIPEVILLTYSLYVFSGTKFNKKDMFKSCMIMAVCVFIIRLLPIVYGVHTILNLIVLSVIGVLINNINMIQTIKSAIISAIILFLSEGINILILSLIFGEKLDVMLTNPNIKTIIALPSLLVFVICIYSYRKIQKRGNK